MLSLFPPPSPPAPEFRTLLVTGAYHPSAPIHLSFSFCSQAPRSRTILFTPSKSSITNRLQNFNDAWLTSNSGCGTISELASRISIFYPSSPTQLCLLLSLLRTSRPGDVGQSQTWINTKTTLANAPNLIVLLEPSAYFLTAEPDKPSIQTSNWPTLPAYISLITRVFAFISNYADQASAMPPLKFALFDSQLHRFELPVIRQVSLPSTGVEGEGEKSALQPRGEPVLPLVEKYFEWVGVFEDDSAYVPSSQGDDGMNEQGIRRQLQFYRVGQDHDMPPLQWREVACHSLFSDKQEIHFRWI
ncbi:hypothetical protein B0H34DRAFT_687147 [Crassisporium funariophilum]|nr:hypothetical protein B0H34DRAFT_687147 [Crassisporium funariophilum]